MIRQRHRSQYYSIKHKVLSASLRFVCTMSLLAGSYSSFGQTVAYWRFEEGSDGTQPVDQVTSPGSTPILDSSGNGYHMGVLDTVNAPTYTSSLPSATIANGGAANNLALDFYGTPQGHRKGGPPDPPIVPPNNPNEIYASGYTGGGLNDIDLATGWTVEVSFKMDTIPDYIIDPEFLNPNGDEAIRSFQGILSKQGTPAPGKGENPLLFRIRNDGDSDPKNPGTDFTANNVKHLEVSGLDGSGDDWNLDSRYTEPLVAGQWYNAAVVYDGTTANLYLDSGSGYKFQQGTPLKTSGWFASTDDWVIGRGNTSDQTDDWMDGQVDEVRISNKALTQPQLLHNDPTDFSDVVTYTVDTTQSFLTWSGDVLNNAMVEQSPGSLTTALGGTIVAHLDGNTLTFDDQSVLDLQENGAAPFEPFLDTEYTVTGADPETFTFPATGEENMAFSVPTLGGPLDRNDVALRDAFFGISWGSADFDGAVSDLEFRTIINRLDIVSDPAEENGSDLSGGDIAGNNLAVGNMTRVTVPGVSEEITIPIEFELIDNNGVIDAIMTGQVVAVRSLVSGDFDNDFGSNGLDFLAWQRGFGSFYDAADFADWEAGFGTPAPLSGAFRAVPEPSSLILLGLTLALVPRRTVQRRRSGA